MRTHALLLLAPFLAFACGGPAGNMEDLDGDGFSPSEGDCDDSDALVHPGAAEIWYDGIDRDCAGTSDFDADADGAEDAALGGEDCDDTRADVGPEAPEVCDGVDNDCDGNADEGDAVDAPGWYPDHDGDGFGVGGDPLVQCDAPSGYASVLGDCDDLDAAVHPGAEELCDRLDNDCDGAFDEGDAPGASTWYPDTDGDGFGAADGALVACWNPGAWVFDASDCDDTQPTVFPGADEVCDDLDNDCDGTVDEDEALDASTWYTDADADGHGALPVLGVSCDPPSGAAATLGDCDDATAGVYPGAWDRPADGLDQDCDGLDRVFDGLVLDEGTTTSTDLAPELVSGWGGLDVVVLQDTTASLSGSLGTLDFTAIDAELAVLGSDIHYGYVTFDDYSYGSFGSTYDLPFLLQQAVTDDVLAVQAAVDATGVHSGSDGTESGLEAVYQALTGAGYDQDCDGVYDASTDVPPFVASATDPFGGTTAGTGDPSISGTGTLGGVGFRGAALPVVFYITDNYLRDPDAGYASPGGCPLDAGSAAVTAASLALDARLVGFSVNSTLPVSQMESLATATGSLADADGDGVAETPLVFSGVATDVNDVVVEAVTALSSSLVPVDGAWEQVWMEATDDVYGLVASIDPGVYEDVTSTDGPFTFTVTWSGTVPAAAEAQQITVTFVVYGDGTALAETAVVVEIPPA